MLSVKTSKSMGCTFLGKGIVDHPEMGVVDECREVVMDELDVFGEWTGNETKIVMLRTDNGYAFDENMLRNGTFKIENYAPNWRWFAAADYPWKV